MFFKTSSHVKNTFNGSTVCPVLGWSGWRFKGEGSTCTPQARTGALRQPQSCIRPRSSRLGKGLVCAGNANLPQEADLWNPVAWETYFFGSHFTPPNFLMKNRLINGKQLWKDFVEVARRALPNESAGLMVWNQRLQQWRLEIRQSLMANRARIDYVEPHLDEDDVGVVDIHSHGYFGAGSPHGITRMMLEGSISRQSSERLINQHPSSSYALLRLMNSFRSP